MSGVRARLQALWNGFQGWYAGHPRRDQRIILGVVIFAAVCVLYLWGVVPLREYRQSVSDEIADGQEQLTRAVRVLASADSLRAERDSLDKRLKAARGRLLPGRGATLGAAALQERTNSLAAEKGVTVQSTQVMKEEPLDPYRKVSVRLTLSGELKPLAELVSGLEYDQQLAIPFVEANRRGAVPGAKGPRTIAATIEVAGFVLGEDAKAEEGAPPEGGETADATGESTTTTVAPGEAAPGAEGGAPASSSTTLPAGATTTSTVAAGVPPQGSSTTTTTIVPGAVPAHGASTTTTTIPAPVRPHGAATTTSTLHGPAAPPSTAPARPGFTPPVPTVTTLPPVPRVIPQRPGTSGPRAAPQPSEEEQ